MKEHIEKLLKESGVHENLVNELAQHAKYQKLIEDLAALQGGVPVDDHKRACEEIEKLQTIASDRHVEIENLKGQFVAAAEEIAALKEKKTNKQDKEETKDKVEEIKNK